MNTIQDKLFVPSYFLSLMRVNFFFREFHQHQISIEKLFNSIIDGVSFLGVKTKKVLNPYPLSIRGIIKSLIFFRNNQGDINHITGDIHWSCMLLDKKKTILTIHDLVGMNQYNGIKKWVYYIVWVYLPIKRLKYITAISEKTKNEILQYMPNAKSKIRVIPNFTSMSIKLDNDENLFLGKPNILIVGTRENKNVERMLIAMRDLDINLCIIGQLSDNQLDIVNKYNIKISNKIEISEDELRLEYSKANILCFVSLYEGFGLPILEAQAQNCCVITSNVSPMKEVAGNGAILVNPLDIYEIKTKILELINDKQKRLTLIKYGKNNVHNYSKEVICKQYVKLYNEIIKEQ